MLDEILQSDSLGNRQQIEYILDVVNGGTSSLPELREACYARSYGYRRSFQALVKLLAWIGYLVLEDDRVVPGNATTQDGDDQFVESFCVRLFATLTASGHLHHLFSNETLTVKTDERTIHLRNNRVPLNYASLRNLLIDLGLMIRDPHLYNVFVVANVHYAWFVERLADWIGDSSTVGKMTLNELKQRLKNQEEAGRIAEEFVVAFEKRRLGGHPRLEMVRMISDLDVGAGYDIQSFESLDSTIVDRYIEVKSYSGKPSFYWSSGEIGAAEKRGKSYSICLVDRDQLSRQNYCPTFIRDPAKHVFLSEDWVHVCDKYYFEQV